MNKQQTTTKEKSPTGTVLTVSFTVIKYSTIISLFQLCDLQSVKLCVCTLTLTV